MYLTSDSNKPRQTTVVIQYCSLSSFFESDVIFVVRLYSKQDSNALSPRPLANAPQAKNLKHSILKILKTPNLF